MNTRLGLRAVLSLGIVALVAHVTSQVLSASWAFGGETGLFVLYGETAAIGVALAALRLLGRTVERPERCPTRHFADLKVLPEKKERSTVDLEVRRAS
jgi:hypothetical protein